MGYSLINGMADFEKAISESETFQTFVDAESAAEALTSIHRYSITPTQSPGAMVAWQQWDTEVVTLDQCALITPVMVMVLVDVVDKSTTDPSVFNALITVADGVVSDVMDNEYFLIRSVSIDPSPERAKASAAQDVVSLRIIVAGHLRDVD